MITIDFDNADRLVNGLNELGTDCKSILSSSKSIDAGRVSSFSPGTVAINSQIQSKLGVVSNLISIFNTTFSESINRFRDAYEKINASVDNINGLNGKNSGVKGKNVKVGSSVGTILGKSPDGKMLRVRCEGKEFYVANTKINCFAYRDSVKKNRSYQNAGVAGSQCQMLAQIYAIDMLRGTTTTAYDIEYGAVANNVWSPYNRMKNKVESPTSSEPITEFAYNELKAGRPVAIQVSQINSANHERHWVTAVGFDSSVQSAADLNPDTMLVLDCVDGEIQTLSKSRAEGGHERYIYKWNGVYQANGATEEFLQKEVNI